MRSLSKTKRDQLVDWPNSERGILALGPPASKVFLVLQERRGKGCTGLKGEKVPGPTRSSCKLIIINSRAIRGCELQALLHTRML
ncbi:hypothetical protein Cadr_000010801 [Camelus dromedarius]|uniref:Uncharacterized protein n=1 Tax=Camelus dromedarius TaxID=9838 RepID=A0A5N4DQ48_CAMDR|nr:hypothetical protein Cadr_000010801 [Camelus dromedarius]